MASKFKITAIATAIGLAVAGGYSALKAPQDKPAPIAKESTLTLGAKHLQGGAASAMKGAGHQEKVKMAALPLPADASLDTPVPKGTSFDKGERTRHISDQIVLKLHKGSDLAKLAKTSPDQFSKKLAEASKAKVKVVRVDGEMAFVKIEYAQRNVADEASQEKDREQQFNSIAESILSLKGVDSYEEDVVLHPAYTVNDSSYSAQWFLRQEVPGGSNASVAWDKTIGKPVTGDMVIGIVDTGITSHSDLADNVIPGYDFVSDAVRANDGNGRDSDPSDSGDFVTTAESASGPFAGCGPKNSSWHGTHVAGIAAAVGNNSKGVIGVASAAKILPVRALGKCGGYMTDISDAIRWAAGLPVDGAPLNPNPAKVINMSLGGLASCPSYLQESINEANKKGVAIVVAAGNSKIDVRNVTPANCSGVMVVGAVGKAGERAYYSDFGAKVSISAPGGDISADGEGIYSTLNSGATSVGGESYAHYQGTSMATPVVAGAMALAMATNPKLSPASAMTLMTRTARPFPAKSLCAMQKNCGAGIIDIGAAIGIADKFQPDLVITRFQPLSPVVAPNVSFDVLVTLANAGTAPTDTSHTGKLEVYVASAVDGSNPVKIGDADIGSIAGINTGTGKTFKVVGLKIADQAAQSLKAGKYAFFAKFVGGEWELLDINNTSKSLVMDYVYPDITIAKKMVTNQAPVDVNFTAVFNDYRLLRVAIGADWVYEWHFSNGQVLKAQLANATVRITTPGPGVATLNLKHIPSGFTKTATISYDTIQAAPTTVSFTDVASNPALRAPVSVRLMPKITAGHPFDRVTGITWDIDNGKTTLKTINAIVNFPAGQHVVKATATTKMGYSASYEKVFNVVENQVPVCSLDYTNPIGAGYVQFNAQCHDNDGVIKGIMWFINGRQTATPAGNPYALKYPTVGNGTLNVVVRAIDDSKTYGEAQVTVAY